MLFLAQMSKAFNSVWLWITLGASKHARQIFTITGSLIWNEKWDMLTKQRLSFELMSRHNVTISNMRNPASRNANRGQEKLQDYLRNKRAKNDTALTTRSFSGFNAGCKTTSRCKTKLRTLSKIMISFTWSKASGGGQSAPSLWGGKAPQNAQIGRAHVWTPVTL